MRRWIFLSLLLTVISLSFLQFVTTDRSSLMSLNEIERVEQLRRMNQYPRVYARLSNLLEARKETLVFFKLEKNFLQIFDLNYFFGGVWQPLLVPFFLIGIFSLIKKYLRETITLISLPVVIITFAGHQNRYGLFSLKALVMLLVLYGLITVFRHSYD